jgi:hypothetical protein
MFQVAVLTYNVEPTVLFDLDDHTKEEGIIDALQTIRGHDAVTHYLKYLPQTQRQQNQVDNLYIIK